MSVPASPERPAAPPPWLAALLRAYPPGWRSRYGAELELLVTDLCGDGRHRVAMAADLLAGAALAWFREGRISMSERSRGALITVLWSWVAFAAVAAWWGHDLAIYPNAPAAARIAQAHPSVPDAYHVLSAAGAVGVGATVIAALIFAVGAARYARAHGRHRIYLLMAVPPAAAAIWLGGLQVLPRGGGGSPGAIGVLWLLLGVAGIAASTQAVAAILRDSEFGAATWRAGGALAGLVVAAMLVATGATIAWGLALHAAQLRVGDAGGWLLATAVMAAASARAVIALAGGLPRRRAGTPAAA